MADRPASFALRQRGGATRARVSRRRVGLPAVPDRAGAWTDVPGAAADRGLRWDDRDVRTRWWYPQGVSAYADPTISDADGTYEGRRLLLTSWYGHGLLGHLVLGSRLSVVDLEPGPAPRYGHVLLVEERRLGGLRRLRRVPVHAGGVAWYGDHVFVAASRGGLRVFALSDLERLRSRVRGRGARHVLPQLLAYEAVTAEGATPLTYSFCSVEQSADGDHLVAGEYGRRGTGRHRVVRYALDRDTALLRTGPDGSAAPVDVVDTRIPRMQGAVVVDGTWTITASAGEGSPGDLWTGRPGSFTQHRGVLPTGPEDLAVEPGSHRVWTLTEWPGHRWVLPVDPARLPGQSGE